MFLFLAASIVAVFAFLSIAVWVSAPAQELKARQRFELLKTVAEQPGENAARVLAMLQEEDRRIERKRCEDERRGYLVGGLITGAVGVGLGIMLALSKGGGTWTLGLMLVLVGCVLVGTGVRIRVPERLREDVRK
jgi:hypothetical protein